MTDVTSQESPDRDAGAPGSAPAAAAACAGILVGKLIS